jgi:hypothetical protein
MAIIIIDELKNIDWAIALGTVLGSEATMTNNTDTVLTLIKLKSS